jgi:hypothetical protein
MMLFDIPEITSGGPSRGIRKSHRMPELICVIPKKGQTG